MDKIAVSKAEAARLLSLSNRTVDRRLADGSIRHVKIGGRVVIPVAELERLVGEAS